MKSSLHLLSAAILIVAAAATASAQIGIGLRGGILTTSEKINDDNADTKVLSSESVTGYTFGIPIEIAVSNVFSIQPEINFQRRSSSKRNELDLGTLGDAFQDIERDIDYLEIPLLFKLGYTTDRFTAAAVFGPSFSYALGGTTTAGNRISAIDNSTVISASGGEFDIDFDREGLNRTEFGAHLGVQGGIPAGPGKVILDARYQLAFTNLNDGNDENNDSFEDFESKSRGFSATLGYMITLGDY